MYNLHLYIYIYIETGKITRDGEKLISRYERSLNFKYPPPKWSGIFIVDQRAALDFHMR